MKTNLKLMLVLLLTISVFSCSDENEIKLNEQTVNYELPDFRAIYLGENTSKIHGLGNCYSIRTESDLIGGGSDECWDVNVRVYSVDRCTGQEYLLANDDVQVGNGCTKNKNFSECSGILKDGNYVYSNDTYDHICLYELLTKNKNAYKQYTDSLNELLNK